MSEGKSESRLIAFRLSEELEGRLEKLAEYFHQQDGKAAEKSTALRWLLQWMVKETGEPISRPDLPSAARAPARLPPEQLKEAIQAQLEPLIARVRQLEEWAQQPAENASSEAGPRTHYRLGQGVPDGCTTDLAAASGGTTSSIPHSTLRPGRHLSRSLLTWIERCVPPMGR
jgi:hypothetical protein